jgi:enoyl-[acyl-carrier-protein] reductase (NADH)
MGFMAGKRVLIVGLASARSIAWGIAQTMHREGAELAFTYQNEKLKSRVEKMAAELGSSLIYPLGVAGIGDFRKMLQQIEDNAPLRRNVTIEDVGNAARSCVLIWPTVLLPRTPMLMPVTTLLVCQP